MAAGQGLKDAVKIYENLKNEWNKNNACDLKLCESLLLQLKIALLQLSFLPSSKTLPSKQELILAREVLELGALWSVKVKNVESFKSYIAQLKTYYFDFKDHLPESSYYHQLLGLNLLCLLATNNIAEFHTELELLDPNLLHNNIYIKHPVVIEQYLMEGSYNKIMLSRSNVPAEAYSFFMDMLVNTIRNEIALCMEAAYQRLPLESAKNMLFFTSNDAFQKYTQSHNWKVESGAFVFEDSAKVTNTIPANQIIVQTLNFAKELEKIV